jgi:hypothetical protein
MLVGADAADLPRVVDETRALLVRVSQRRVDRRDIEAAVCQARGGWLIDAEDPVLLALNAVQVRLLAGTTLDVGRRAGEIGAVTLEGLGTAADQVLRTLVVVADSQEKL